MPHDTTATAGAGPAGGSATLDRRCVLACTVAGGAALTLAACGSPARSSPGPSSTSSGGAAVAGGTKVASLDSLKDGATSSVSVGNSPLLVQRTGSTVSALSAVCPHQGCTVAPSGALLLCPCHGSEFKAGSGELIQGPAQTGLQKVAVKVVAADVVLA